MKKALVYLTLLLNFLFLSCSDDDHDKCESVNCSVPLRFLTFDLIDTSTQKNVFADNIYDPNLLEVFNTDNNKIEFQFVDTENYIVAIYLITPNPDVKDYTFKISDKIVFKLKVETKNNNDKCCPFIVYSEVKISDAEFHLNTENGNYEISVE